MNNLKTYFASPGKKRTNGTAVLLLAADSATKQLRNSGLSDTAVDKVVQLETAKENGTDGVSFESTSPLYIIKKPSVDSKLILQNMEEVLNSVKKKHRQKHRRKKEQKKLAQLEAEAVAIAVKAKADQESITQKQQNDSTVSKNPLSEKTKQVINGGGGALQVSKSRQTPMKNLIESASLKGAKTITPSPKMSESLTSLDERCEHVNDVSCEENVNSQTSKKKSTKTNAFEVLMNARNKSIGSNTSGKEMTAEEDNRTRVETAASVKRKQLLQDWADRKGGAKRKLEEENRAAYVEKKLETRAKRFKKMLVNGSAAKTVDNPTETSLKKSRNKNLKRKSTRVKLNIKENEAEKPKHRRGSLRSKRVASVDSVDEEAPPTATSHQDRETIDFLAQLSSPTKKRDSLLGYFPKKESPDLSASKKCEESKEADKSDKTPRRTRRQTAERTRCEHSTGEAETATRDAENPTKDPQLPKADSTLNVKTTSDRPRRSCAGKARYDYDLEVSPTKFSKHEKTAKEPRTQIVHSTHHDEVIIDLDDSNTQTPSDQKLAPLFVRSVPKPSPNPEKIAARHAFLMSGVPAKLRIEQLKQKQFEQSYDETLELFPKISHVLQLTEDQLQWTRDDFAPSFKLKSIEEEPLLSKNRHSKVKKMRDMRQITTGSHDQAPLSFSPFHKQPLPQVPEKRLIIKAWKAKYERFPIYRCYNQMREKYRYFNAIDSAQDTEQVTESFVVTRRNARRSLQLAEQNDSDASSEEAKPPAMAPNGELMFTEKYKPLLFEQFLVNLSPVAELREFLATWSTGTRNSQGTEDSDFDDSNSSNSNQQATCNTVVLMGPSSSGKTSSVFAVANELNFNVLEINAGMKRTGKKLMQELQEATQSHQLRKNTTAHGKSHKSLLKMSLNGRTTKAKKTTSKSLGADDNHLAADSGATAARKCLILIEDADIVFDQMDAGFTDAIYTLAASSKRPVIIVASDVNCPHLQRLIQQNTIYFKEPSTLNISRYMAVLALLENCPVKLDDLISLYIYNKKDLRKTLLELQFFTQSGGDRRKREQDAEEVSVSLFASPNKTTRFFEESTCLQGTDTDDVPKKEPPAAQSNGDAAKLYIHQHLFDFFTLPQNESWRIPFPVNFDMLRNNFDEILQSSQTLSKYATNRSDKRIIPAEEPTTKRKSRSPKKVWLTAAAQKTMPLADLCDFYENISIASLLGTHGKELPNTENNSMPQFKDKLLPHLADDIAHCMVAGSIDHNLEAQQFSYNLISAPLKKISLGNWLGNLTLRSKQLLAVEFDPTLRSICRSEKTRAANDRRSSRFYHYLGNSFKNANERLEDACSVFLDDSSGLHASCEHPTNAQ